MIKILMFLTSIVFITVSGIANQNVHNPLQVKKADREISARLPKSLDLTDDNPKVMIMPEYVEDYSGNSVSVDIVLFNFNTDTTSLVAIEFYIDFDNSVATFTGADSFNALMPANQWFFSNPSPELNRFACNWAEPALNNLSVPDNTAIMTLHFQLINNDTPLSFDQASSLFVHIDPLYNLIELDIEYLNGFIHVMTIGIEDNETVNENLNWVHSSGDELIFQDVEGIVSIFTLSGQRVFDQQISNSINRISFKKTGLFIVMMRTDDERQLVKKLFIH